MGKVELRLTDVEPPASDPPRTIYTDLVNLPDPAKLGLTCRIFNNDDVGLYMRVDGYKTGWTFTTNDLGLLGSGANIYRNLDDFGTRAKPASELEETITVRLRAYTDSGYTDLKWTFERTITVVFINSADPAYTTDVLNNFDDGTVQGWDVVLEAGDTPPLIEVATDYVLSPPYSCRMTLRAGSRPLRVRCRLYKSFTTPDKATVYAIMDIRDGLVFVGNSFIKNIRVQRDLTLLVFLGRPYDTVGAEYVPKDKWMRIVVPLPRNTTLELRIVDEYYQAYIPDTRYQYLWLDDFKIISK